VHHTGQTGAGLHRQRTSFRGHDDARFSSSG
jgi:hypothetical protein